MLLIEDDEQIVASLAKVLRQQRHVVEIADQGAVGLAKLNAAAPDVVVLDLGLPDLDGTDVLKMIRSISDVPVIIATARDDEETIVRALDLGADEYVVKPFSGEQLDARIRAVLRRGRMKAPSVVTLGDLRVDISAHEATIDGRPLELRRREFELLSYLAERAGELVSRDEIAREVWNDPLSTTSSTIDVHISALRRQLGETAAEPKYLRAVRGVGVKLVAPGSEP